MAYSAPRDTLDLNRAVRLAADLELATHAGREAFRRRIEEHYTPISTYVLREIANTGRSTLRSDALRMLADRWIIELLSRQVGG
jgi:hypothetical protein